MALGAAVGEAVIGRQIGRKALLWGAICGTLPDLDVFVPLGNAVMDFTYHRSASHSFFVLALLTPLLVWLVNRIHPQHREQTKRWAVMIYAVFVTHILLDSFTAYGTQIFWPIDNTPVNWSTIFIIDPAYTLPLLLGIVVALVSRRQGVSWNTAGLALSSLYLTWTVAAKLYTNQQFEAALDEQGIEYRQIFTTPTPFNSLLWRAVVMDDKGYYEGYTSLFDNDKGVRFRHFESREELLGGMEEEWNTQRLRWFTKGIYAVSQINDKVVISDLRMGYEPDYVFRFAVAKLGNPSISAIEPEQLAPNRDWSLLKKIWQRIWNQDVDLKAG